nr:M48 family metalloprotease [Paracoccus sp. (in: a-proteobacteria)]
MLKLTPILLIILYALAMWAFSAWRLRQELNARSTPLTDPRLNAALDRLGAAMGLGRVKAHVYEIAPVNGLAAPDGRVFLTRGFLDQLDAGRVTEAELASVIAHELGHVAHGHTRRRMMDFAGQNVIRAVLVGVFGRFIPVIGPWLAVLVASALAARLSRQDEYEADAFAAALMVKAGFGTAPQKTLLARLGQLT